MKIRYCKIVKITGINTLRHKDKAKSNRAVIDEIINTKIMAKHIRILHTDTVCLQYQLTSLGVLRKFVIFFL